MLENNIINQIKKYHENLELDVIEPKGFKLNEYTYVLGDKQKQMIIDAESKRPYDTFKYYFLQSNPTVDADRQVMKGCFEDRWEMQPERGYQNLRIICEDITYSNLIIDQELIDSLIKSIDELHEKLDLDYPNEPGKLFMGSYNGYRLSTQDKLNFIDWIKRSSPNELEKVWCSLGRIKDDYVIESLDRHVTGIWALSLYDKDHNTIELMGHENEYSDEYNNSYEKFWTMLIDFPIDYLNNFIAEDADRIIKILKGELKEDLELDVASNYSPEDIAQAIAEKIGDCIVDKNVVYQMMHNFEIYTDNEDNRDETIEIPYGIFAIYEVLPDGGVVAWNTSAETCEDVDGIGHNPINYYRTHPMDVCKNLREFIDFLDRWFGRDWFGTEEEIEDFLGTYDIKENLDLDVVERIPIKDRILYEDGFVLELSEREKGEVSLWLGMEDEEWNRLKDKKWEIVKDGPEVDAWWSESDEEEFPYALLIDGSFYDALSESCMEDVIHTYEN